MKLNGSTIPENNRLAREQKIGDEGNEEMPGGVSERREGGDGQQVGRECFVARAGCGERFKGVSIFRLISHFRDLT